MNQSENLVVGGQLPSIYFSLLFDAFMISSNDVECPTHVSSLKIIY
jgi:hypothetical protein